MKLFSFHNIFGMSVREKKYIFGVAGKVIFTHLGENSVHQIFMFKIKFEEC